MAGNDADETMARLLSRVQQHTAAGLDHHQAWGKADLERRLESIPAAWGNTLQVLIYGDFEPPDTDLTFPAIGITVLRDGVTDSGVTSSQCVLKATVSLTERTISGMLDAIRRINVLLGVWTVVHWGNPASGWWSYFTHGTMGGVVSKFNHESLDPAIATAASLRPEVRRKVDAALFWVREPRRHMGEWHRSDVLRIYTAYWNAFECLVGAVLVLRPLPRRSKDEKQRLIDRLLADRGGRLTSADITACYQQIVNPGFVGSAIHALRVCFEADAEHYIRECFRQPDQPNRLYDVRNAINHGEIDAENPEELLRVEARLRRLWMILWKMFGRLLPFPSPVDRDLNPPTA